jgi:hypothetical protein
MRPREWHSALAIVLTVIVLLAAYVGSYCLVLEDGRRIGRIEGDLAERLPQYRSDALAVEIFFWPIHQVDRLVRRERWGWEGIP